MKTPDLKELNPEVIEKIDTLEETIEFAIEGFDEVHQSILKVKEQNDEDIEQVKAIIAENKTTLLEFSFQVKEILLEKLGSHENLTNVHFEEVEQKNAEIECQVSEVKDEVAQVQEELKQFKQFKEMKFFGRLRWLFTGKVK